VCTVAHYSLICITIPRTICTN